MSDLPLVSPGDKLPRSAGTFNEFTKAARQAKQHDIGTPPPSNQPTAQQSTIQVYNDTGTDITEQYAVVGMLDPVFLPELDDNALRTFKNTPCFNIEYPATAATAGRYAILQQPLSDGRIGIAVLDGKTVGIVDSRTEIGMAVEATAASSDEMLSPSVYGNATVLWKGDADGLPENSQIALLRVGNAPRRDGMILVQNNYPFQLRKLTPVGIDFPIIEQDVTDGASLTRFVDEETVYSCMAAQARHANRIAILQQDLDVGQWGYAVLEGLTKAVVHEAPPITYREQSSSGAIQSTEFSTETYRSLGIPGADWETGYGTEYYINGVTDTWGPRHRSKTLWSMTARRPDGDALASPPLPYGVLGATSNGRISAHRLMRIPEVTPTGSSTATCIGGAWKITSSTCSDGSSSDFAIEFAPYPIGTGAEDDLTYPCTEDDTVTTIPCYSTFQSDDEYDIRTVPWSGANDGSVDDDNTRELIALVSLGNSSDSPHAASSLQSLWGNSDTADDQHLAEGEFYSCDLQYLFDTGADMTPAVRRCCANITCTYQHETDGSWTLYRGVEPYTLGEYYDGSGYIQAKCICPTSLVNDRATKEFANESLKEITLGMVFWNYNSTTTTTSSTTTTTAPPGACCHFTLIEGDLGNGNTYARFDSCSTEYEADCPSDYEPGDTSYQIFTAPGGDCSLCYGACCDEENGTCEEVFGYASCDIYSGGGLTEGGEYSPGRQHQFYNGLECADITCPLSSTTTTTTSSTTTTTGDTSSTTTSSTTTTTEESSSSTTTSSTTTTTEESSSTTTSSTTTTTAGSSSTTTSSTTTTTASCGAAPNLCYYECQNTGMGPAWVNTSQVGCTSPCSCTNDSGIVSASCGLCDGENIGTTCGDYVLCDG